MDPIWLIFAALLGVQAYFRSRRPRDLARREFARTRDTPIADIKDGERASVTGIVGAVASAMRSPIGGETCVAFRLEVRRAGEDDDNSSLTLAKDDGGAFSITDATGTMQVEGPFLVVFDPKNDWTMIPPEDLDFLEEEGVRTTGILDTTEYLYREWLLRPGDQVSVRGLAFLQLDPTSASPGFRSPPIVLCMRGSAQAPIIVGATARSAGR